MLDFINVALRTIMCLAFIAFVVRPMLMSMIRREPNTLELEEMAQLDQLEIQVKKEGLDQKEILD